MPTRSGTAIRFGPRETVSVTVSLFRDRVPTPGSAATTCPAGTDSLYTSVIRPCMPAASRIRSASARSLPSTPGTVPYTAPEIAYVAPPTSSTRVVSTAAQIRGLRGSRRRAAPDRRADRDRRARGVRTGGGSSYGRGSVSSCSMTSGGTSSTLVRSTGVAGATGVSTEVASPVGYRGLGRVEAGGSASSWAGVSPRRTRWSAASSSTASNGRRSRSRAQAPATIASSSGTTPGTVADGGGTSSCRCRYITWTGFSPVCGREPVSISYSRMPAA